MISKDHVLSIHSCSLYIERWIASKTIMYNKKHDYWSIPNVFDKPLG